MADFNPNMKHKWLKFDYIPVLNVHLFTESLRGITQDLYFKENQF